MSLILAALPGDIDPDESTRALTEGMRGLQVTAVRLAGERDRVILLAALVARLARAYRRDRDRLLRANLALQVELDAAAVRERYAAVQVRAYAREVAELQAARRGLAAENAGLRERREPGQRAGSKPARGRRRR